MGNFPFYGLTNADTRCMNVSYSVFISPRCINITAYRGADSALRSGRTAKLSERRAAVTTLARRSVLTETHSSQRLIETVECELSVHEAFSPVEL